MSKKMDKDKLKEYRGLKDKIDWSKIKIRTPKRRSLASDPLIRSDPNPKKR